MIVLSPFLRTQGFESLKIHVKHLDWPFCYTAAVSTGVVPRTSSCECLQRARGESRCFFFVLISQGDLSLGRVDFVRTVRIINAVLRPLTCVYVSVFAWISVERAVEPESVSSYRTITGSDLVIFVRENKTA